MDVSIILPTYNEAENMRLIIPRISEVLEMEKIDYEIVVVDDGSPDGTADVARSLSCNHPVHVHVREGERGLATAVIRGFELARGEIALVMDADMSHPVEMLPHMLRPIMDGKCDATVGSRYVKGGGSEEWPIHRRIISRGAGLLARGVTTLKDPTSGFMAIRKTLLRDVTLDPVGWKIVLEVVVKADPSVIEIPISFSDRIKGESKLSMKAQVDYLRHLRRLYAHRYRRWVQFAKFSLVGMSGMILDTAIVVALVELLFLDPRLAAVFAFLGAVSWNFVLNQRWTFPADAYARNVYVRYLSFFSICVVGLGIRIGVMHALLTRTVLGQGRGYILASVAGIIAATVFNFLGNLYVTFRPEKA